MIRSGASGLPYHCAPLVCMSDVIDSLAVWWHNKPKTKINKKVQGRTPPRFLGGHREAALRSSWRPHPQPYQPGYLCRSSDFDLHLHAPASEGLPLLQNLQQIFVNHEQDHPTFHWCISSFTCLYVRHPRQRDDNLRGHP